MVGIAIKEGTRGGTIKGNLKRLQESLTNEEFLDALTIAFIAKEVDIEFLLKQSSEGV